MSIKVKYFASLREQAGCNEEIITTPALNPSELFDQLSKRYDFSLGKDHIKVAVNGSYGSMQSPLVEGDEVVFIPPVAGG